MIYSCKQDLCISKILVASFAVQATGLSIGVCFFFIFLNQRALQTILSVVVLLKLPFFLVRSYLVSVDYYTLFGVYSNYVRFNEKVNR